ncbi:ParB/RepB/Spo0J family partition protein [Devriesea agamarum]|uniref:ParB/RepB/Spo0J family partition protein n=1 Tax=Devriesea agamarum TaxID=472569 RepID=UPI00071DB5FD|nr:ParB/RepB/Spo0J family partition protein [Devriesea agamarum]
MTQKRGLGRGLGALIPGAATRPTTQVRTPAHESDDSLADAADQPSPKTQVKEGDGIRENAATSSKAARRPVDMFFSGPPVDSDVVKDSGSGTTRSSGVRRDLAEDMARAAAERKNGAKRTARSRATGGAASADKAATSATPAKTKKSSRSAAASGSAEPTAAAQPTGAAKSSSGARSGDDAKSEGAATTSGGAQAAGNAKATSRAKLTGDADVAGSGQVPGAVKPSKTKVTAGSAGGRATKATKSPGGSTKASGGTTKSTGGSAGEDVGAKASGDRKTEASGAAKAKASITAQAKASTPDTSDGQDSLSDSKKASLTPTASGTTGTSPSLTSAKGTAGTKPAEEAKDAQTAPDVRATKGAQDHQGSKGAEAGKGAPVAASTPKSSGDAQDQPAPVINDGPDLVSVPGAEFAEIPIEEIRENPRNPRTIFDDDELDELAYSLREVGMLQPVVVRPISATDAGESFELVMGERRWRAARRAGLTAIPAIIRETSDDDLLRDALLENLHRTQLNPLEEAAAYQQLLDDFGCTQDELGERIGRSRPQISNTLRLLKLPPLVQRRLASGALSAGHARALLSLDDAALIEELAQRIVAEGLSVRAVEKLVAGGTQPVRGRTAPRRTTYNPRVVDLTSQISNRFEVPVRIDMGKRKGKLTLEFTSLDELEQLAHRMGIDLHIDEQ